MIRFLSPLLFLFLGVTVMAQTPRVLWAPGEGGADAFKPVKATAAVVEAKGGKALQVDFPVDAGYPRVGFAAPSAGWDLGKFAGVEVEVTNPGAQKIAASLGIRDGSNPAMLNGQRFELEAGQSATVRLIFGETDGGTAQPVDVKSIREARVEMHNTKQPAQLLITALRAWGTAAEHPDFAKYSRPADRDKPAASWAGEKPPVPGDWVRTLDENFDGDTLNTKLWRPSDRTDTYGKDYLYEPENVSVGGGFLRLLSQKKQVEQWPYTSGQVVGFGKWAQCYGYFEARIKLPTVRGLFSAVWLMPDRDVNGPTDQQSIWNRNTTKRGGMEFDILEYMVGYGPGRYNIGAHWDGYGAEHRVWSHEHNYFGPTPDGWHTFGLLWEPGRATWYCDGVKKATWANPRVGSVPAHFLLSAQMFGWNPDNKTADDAKLPYTTEIDWVRAWQLKERLP